MASLSRTEAVPFLSYSDDPNGAGLERQYPTQNRQRRTRTIVSHALVFIATSVLWLLLLLVAVPSITKAHHYATGSNASRHNITSGATLITCGNTTQEARERGCTYDILLNHWVPAPCADPDMLEEYKDDGSWGGFADEGLTQRLTVEEMSERDFYYTSIRDHVNHCAIMWRKQYFAFFEERAAIDSVVAGERHTEHCTQYLMDAPDNKDMTMPTKTYRSFAGCWLRK